MYRWSPLRTRLLPTIEEAMRARKLADAPGSTRDVRPLMATLMRLFEANPRLGGHVTSRRAALTAYGYAIEPVPGAPDAAQRQANDAARRLSGLLDALLKHQVQAALYGAVVLRADVQYSGLLDAQVMQFADVYDPDEVERPTTNVSDVRLLSDDGGTLSRIPVPQDGTHIVAVDDTHPWPGGILRTLMMDQILRLSGKQEWANFLRKLKGIIQATMKGGVPPEGDPEREVAEKALQTAVRENYALTSDRTTFNYNRLAEAMAGQSFKSYKKDIDTDTEIAFLGQAGTAELPKNGARAAVEALNLVRIDIQLEDIKRTETVANEQILLQDYRLNVSRAATTVEEVPYRFRVVRPRDDDSESEARAIGDTLDAGIPLVADEVYQRLGFTRPEGTPDILRRSDLRTRDTTL